MGRVIVIEFVTLDGVVTDPDGSGGTPRNEQRDIVVTGSSSVVDTLQQHDLVDEYRRMTFPVTIGEGRRLFTRPVELRTVSAEQVGAGVRTRYERVR